MSDSSGLSKIRQALMRLTPAHLAGFMQLVLVPEKKDDCWIWLGTQNQGYGIYSVFSCSVGAHRVSLVLHGTTIPPHLVVDHKCRNRLCVNPSHMRLVTHKTNTLENSVSITAFCKNKTCCTRGHEFTPENTFIYFDKAKGGSRRICRKCDAIRSANYRNMLAARATKEKT